MAIELETDSQTKARDFLALPLEERRAFLEAQKPLADKVFGQQEAVEGQWKAEHSLEAENERLRAAIRWFRRSGAGETWQMDFMTHKAKVGNEHAALLLEVLSQP